MSIRLDKRADGWWLTGLPTGFTDQGPYATRPEAQEAREGIARFFREEWDASRDRVAQRQVELFA